MTEVPFRPSRRGATINDLLRLRRDILETVAGEAVRVDVVASVAELPASAPPTRLFRVATAGERTNVYLGNGPGQPLLKITGTLLP